MGGGMRKILAAVLYIVGAAAVIFVAYQYHAAPDHVAWGYFPLWWTGVALVAAAGLLWPGPDLSHPTEGEAN